MSTTTRPGDAAMWAAVDVGAMLALLESPAVIEAVAAWDHDEAWSGWTRYMLDKLEQPGFVERRRNIERWRRQIATAYVDLSEGEKESDRSEARRVLAVIRAALEAGRGD